MRATMQRLPAIILASMLAGACVATPPPVVQPADARTNALACRSASVTIAFDFEGASQSRCTIEGERAFSILVSPEHAPPINPSAWYAFRYAAAPGPDVTITLRYLDSEHRYRPKREVGGEWQLLETEVAEDDRSARFTLPPGAGVVAGQEIYASARYADLIARLGRSDDARRFMLGRSHEGRPIDALEIGDASAPNVVVLLGRAHPPEVTGALAMEAFLVRLVELVEAGALEGRGIRFLAVPSLNPDGVARGHWRANLGATDLNRDWGRFAQPETRSVKRWLDSLPTGHRPIAMVDFHSTQRDVFYTIPPELPTVPAQFTERWLDAIGARVPEFEVRRSPGHTSGSGVAKNWFYETYGIPAVTFEIGDETDRDLIAKVARAAAEAMIERLVEADLTVPGE